jgi:hypothetical protein
MAYTFSVVCAVAVKLQSCFYRNPHQELVIFVHKPVKYKNKNKKLNTITKDLSIS